MATVVLPIQPESGIIGSTAIPELVQIAGTNFPVTGYAFQQNSVSVLYFKLGAALYGSGNLTLDMQWESRSGSTSGNVTWSGQLAAITPGEAQSVETKAFASAQTVNTTVNATAKGDTLSSLTITNLDSVAAGDIIWLRLTRTDTSMTGDAVLLLATLSYQDGQTGSPGSGDYVGPASATDTAIVLFNGTTGKLGKNSSVLVDNSGNLTGVGTVNTVLVDRDVCTSSESQRIFQSALPNIAAGVTTSNTAYFVYVGQVTKTLTVVSVEAWLVTVGTGTSTGEVGLFSTSSAPNRAGQSLTKIASTATITSLTAAGNTRIINTSSFAQSVTAGTHLWAGIRTANTTTQPTLVGLTNDFGDGRVLSLASAGALTAAGPFSGALLAVGAGAVSWLVPLLRVTLD